MSIAWGAGPTQYFYDITPDTVLSSVEKTGIQCTGRCMALGSMENRVYEVEVEGANGREFRVVKFYRPGRWSWDQIQDEHDFLLDLEEVEIPVVAPIDFPDGETINECESTGIYFCVFPRVGGRSSDEMLEDQLIRLGRQIARIHNVGATHDAPHRVLLTPDVYGRTNLDFILSEGLIKNADYRSGYEKLVNRICDLSDPIFDEDWAQNQYQRIHGDCHLGNIIWRPEGPVFVDFDDMVIGPPVQDLWLLFPWAGEEVEKKRDAVLAGYEEMRQFDRRGLALIEPLRSLRFVHFAAWIGKRWEDPAFQNAFPDYGSDQYWQSQIQDLRVQLGKIEEFTQTGIR